MTPHQDLDRLKKATALKAVEFVRDGMVVGLGTGSTANHMVIALGEKVFPSVLANRLLHSWPNSASSSHLRAAADAGLSGFKSRSIKELDVRVFW